MKQAYLMSVIFLWWCAGALAMDSEPKPVKFDELPPLSWSSDWHDKPIVIHPEYIRKARCNKNFSLMIPLIRFYCDKNPTDYCSKNMRFLCKHAVGQLSDGITPQEFTYDMPIARDKKLRRGDFYYYQEKICERLQISLQTTYAVEQTYLHILEGHFIDLDDARLTHDLVRETVHKKVLIDQLPLSLSVLCTSAQLYSHCLHIDKLIKPIFEVYVLRKRSVRYDKSYWIRQLVEETKVVVSPQSVARAAEEYHALVNNGIIPSGKSYDEREERDNLMFIISRFPKELKMNDHVVIDLCYTKLAFEAYVLGNPRWEEALVELDYNLGQHWNIKYYIAKILCGDKQGGPSYCFYEQLAEPIVAEFVAIFSKPGAIPALLSSTPAAVATGDVGLLPLLSDCYEELRKRLCILDGSIAQQLVAVCKELQKSSQLEAMNREAIRGYFLDQLPKCPICLDPFANHFTPEAGSAVGTEVILSPCKHTVCSTCKPQLQGLCPLCRSPLYVE